MDFPIDQLRKDLSLLKTELSDVLDKLDNESFQKKLVGALRTSSGRQVMSSVDQSDSSKMSAFKSDHYNLITEDLEKILSLSVVSSDKTQENLSEEKRLTTEEERAMYEVKLSKMKPLMESVTKVDTSIGSLTDACGSSSKGSLTKVEESEIYEVKLNAMKSLCENGNKHETHNFLLTDSSVASKQDRLTEAEDLEIYEVKLDAMKSVFQNKNKDDTKNVPLSDSSGTLRKKRLTKAEESKIYEVKFKKLKSVMEKKRPRN